MPRPSFSTKARNSPLGSGSLNRIIDEARDVEARFVEEHQPDGEHNLLEYPRDLITVEYSGGSYSVAWGGELVTSLSRVSAGVIDITLSNPEKLVAEGLRLIYQAMALEGEDTPRMVNAARTASNVIRVNIHKLAALAGNSWSAADSSFCLVLYGSPYDGGGGLVDWGDRFARGHTLSATTWNKVVNGISDFRDAFNEEHDISTGTHRAETKMSIGYYAATWTGAAYSQTAAHNVASFSRGSTGVLEVVIDGSLRLAGIIAEAHSTTKLHVMCADFASWTDTLSPLFLYAYDPSTGQWARADANLSLTFHPQP